MDSYRFHVADLIVQAGAAGAEGAGGGVRLPGDQAHHARAVLRLGAGAAVTLFDGRGAWAEGTIASLSKSELTVELRGGVHVDPPAAVALTLAVAIPKGERAEWLVEQASQLDVARVQWLDCDRSVVKPRGGEGGGGKIEKWRRVAIESAKQCGRTHVMEILEPVGVEGLLAAAVEGGEKIFWLEPREGEGSSGVGAALAGRSARIMALIGPEGGWSEREFALLEAAAQEGKVTRVRLTRTVLRIETACAAIAAIVMSAE